MNGFFGALCFATGVAVGSLITVQVGVPVDKPIQVQQEIKSSKEVVQDLLDEIVTKYRAKLIIERSA